MNILFIPQLANRSYSTGKWSLLKDGHVGMIKNQIRILSKQHNFSLIMPPYNQVEDICNYRDIFFEEDFKEYSIKFIEVELSKNVAFNRFHFNMNKFLELNEYFNFDLILTDIPELTRNFKMLFVLNKKNVKIISNLHYLDLYTENQLVTGTTNYFWRQFEGLICSDAFTFLTEKMKQDFFSYASIHIQPEFLEKLKEKVSVLDNMVLSETELNMFQKPKRKEKIINFISRCSDEKRTKWKDFIIAVKKLRKERNDFKVVIANPTHIHEQEILDIIGNEDKHYFSIFGSTSNRQKYIESLWESHCVPLLYDIENNLAVGFYEALFCNNIPVQYKIDFQDINDLPSALSKALDSNLQQYQIRRANVIEKRSAEFNSHQFIELINKVMYIGIK